MDFALNEIQQDLSQLAEKILREASTGERLQALEKSGQRLDAALWQQLIESGLTAVAIDEAHGGAGLGFFENCLVLQQMGKTVAAIPLPGHSVGALALQQAAAADALEALLSGSGWLATSVRTQGNALVASGDTLSGSVGTVPCAIGSQALLLPARRDGEWQLYLVATEQAGVTLQAQTSTGLEPQALVTLKGASARAIGDAGLLAALRERLVIATCAHQLGVLEETLEMTTRYVSEREQFGVKIGSFQAVSHRLADAWIDVMNLRLLTQSAAAMLDRQPLATLEVLSAQTWCADAGHRVLASCQHVHGGMGHDRDYPLWRYAVWARHNELAQGSASQATAALGAAIAREPAMAVL